MSAMFSEPQFAKVYPVLEKHIIVKLLIMNC